MRGPCVAAPVSAADNGRLTAESSTSALDADGVEGQEKASLAPLFKWAEALFESQQHATNQLQGQPSRRDVRGGRGELGDGVRCVVWSGGVGVLRQGKSLSRCQDLNYSVRTQTTVQTQPRH